VHRRLPEGIAGIALLHELIGQHAADSEDADDPGQVVIGIETDRGPAEPVGARRLRRGRPSSRRLHVAAEEGFRVRVVVL
jgi:hypothetical protein